MYSLFENSDNHSITSGRFWNYYGDEVNGTANEIVTNHRINNIKTTTCKSFEYDRQK